MLDVHGQIAGLLRSPACLEWLDLTGSSAWRLLDYACRSGIVTQALQPHLSSAIGIDVSYKMVGMYNANAGRLNLGPDAMVGVVGDLTAAQDMPTNPFIAENRLRDFDLVAICMALHHLDDPFLGLARLAGRLKPGGKLLVVDWAPLDGSTPAQRAYAQQLTAKEDGMIVLDDHSARHTVSKPDGLSEEEMREIFERCGCVDTRCKLAEALSEMPPADKKLQLFCACATRAMGADVGV